MKYQVVDGLLNQGILKTASGDPFTTMLLMGGLLLFVSVKGVVGAVTGSRRLLLVYFGFLLLLCCMLLYAAVISWCYSSFADEVAASYMRKLHQAAAEDKSLLAANPDQIRAGERFLRRNLRSASLLCGGAAGLMLLAMWSASKVMGHHYALANISSVISFSSFILGGIVIWLAVALKGDDQATSPITSLLLASGVAM